MLSTYYAQKCAYYAQRVTWCSSILKCEIFRFRMSSDCGGARSLLRRDGAAELVTWELVQTSLPSLRSLHSVLVAIVNRHVV